MRLLIYVLFAVASALALFFVSNSVAVGYLTGVSTALLIPIIDLAITHPYGPGFLWKCFKLRNEEVRISASYLIRIGHRGNYLLVQGSRYPDQFQPIGGVYKFNPSAVDVFRKWNSRTDDLIPIDDSSVNDLRIRIKGKFIPSFLAWFKNGSGREQGAFREFYEEVVLQGGLSEFDLTGVRFDFVRRHINPIRHSSYAQCDELLVADIFELACSESQMNAVIALASRTSPSAGFVLADAERIRRRGAIPGKTQEMKIALTAEWLL